MEHPSALVDPSVLRELHEFRMPDEPDPAAEVAQAFLAVTPDRLAQLRHAVNHGLEADVIRITHQLRGSCAAVGAIAMHVVATQLEAAQTPADMHALTQQLEALFTRTRPLLESIEPR